MDSSPDLSLKLRRGSSDSRDNFYMDFAQGIDSDIEEVDNSAIERDPQQVPTPPPLPVVDDIDLVAIPSNIPPPPLGMMYGLGMGVLPPPPPPTTTASGLGPLPTLTESDDLPPTPPPHFGTDEESTAASPPPPMSPTSVLEMVPPPPMASPPMQRAALPPSPPLDTEDEGDDADVEETPDEEEEEEEADEPELEEIMAAPKAIPKDDEMGGQRGEEDAEQEEGEEEKAETDDEEKSTPPPPLPPLPSNLSYVHGSGAHGTELSRPLSPTLTKSPSTSPTPPASPQPGDPEEAPAPPPPLTPPSDSDQSQPNSPPPRSKSKASPQPPAAAADVDGEDSELMAALAAVAAGSDPLEPRDAGPLLQQLSEEGHTYNEEESTTITTPPSNGFSGSSILAPTAEELEEDAANTEEMCLADIPPPEGMEDEAEDQQGEEEEEEEQEEGEDVAQPTTEDPTITEGTEADDEEEQPALHDDDREATPIPTPPVAGTPKRSGSIGTAGGAGGSRAASRSGSRSSSIRSASRSGSVRGGSAAGGSIASRSASIAAAASAAASSASAVQPVVGITSPPASIKSFRSQSSVKSTHSKKLISSPPPALHSPPVVTSPPRIYSPPQMASPPLRKPLEVTPPQDDADMAPTAPSASPSPPSQSSPPNGKKPDSPVKSSVITTETSGSGVGAKELAAAAIASAPVAAAAASSTRPHLSSHHHYHLPHQFQHPHHQNHHTHSHGSVPVPTPTVPATYSMLHEVRHIRAASGGTSDDSGPSTSSHRRSSPPTPPTAAAPSPNLAGTSEASGSPVKLTARIRDSGSQHRVTIDESSLPHHVIDMNGGGPGHGPRRDSDGSEPTTPEGATAPQLDGDGVEGGDRHLALMYHSHQLTNYPVMPAIKRTHRPSFVYPPMPRVKAGDALATLFSALYGKILVVMGIAFPMAEVISTYIPPSFYEVYYLYLYIGSMIFLLFMYATLLWGRPKIPITSPSKSTVKTRTTSASESMDESDTDSTSIRNKHLPPVITSARRPSLLSPLGRQHHYGSFYLRMGAVAFGIGSMIYSGLEFGQYFELNPDTKCHNVLLALTPATRMAFIFIQMYFIFLNNEQIKVYRYKIIARFGLMHMIGTNLAVWLNVLIQETKHEILTFYNPENRTLRISHRLPGHSRGAAAHAIVPALDTTAHLRVPRGLKGPYQIFECRRTNILGTLVQDASPFLFPCTIEYSLICAAILYVMWRSISRPQTPTPQRPDTISSPMKRSPHHYSVDCARAHKGLFVGILILVLTIISLILFFVLISRPDFVSLAVTEVTICELLIYGTATIATLVGMIQMRHLQYDAYRSFSLDDILLVGAQTGSFLYNIFTVIAGHFTLRGDDMLVPINALASIVQTACQTMFILDASRRQAVSPEHIRKKPGREIVTFMLVVNLAMWAISTLEKSRAESHPIQLNFYGLWAWTIITHVSMPLAIFYRFHSTVCLCEIWKRAYKLKPTYM